MKRHTRWGLVEQRSVDSALVTARWRSCSGLTTTAKSTGRSRSRRMGVALLVVDPAEPPSALGTVSAQSFGAVVVGGAAVDSGAIVQGAVHASDTLPHRHQDSDIVRPALTSCRSARPREARKRACNARMQRAHARMQRGHARMQRAHATRARSPWDGDVRLGCCGEALGRGHPAMHWAVPTRGGYAQRRVRL
jgi:hypothetical protein